MISRAFRGRVVRVAAVPIIALLALTPLAGTGQAQDDQITGLGEASERVWNRTDLPVRDLVVARTWMWGPEAFSEPMTEPYVDSPGGERLVQYFDKSRMEINDPEADADELWYITNGLLAQELITGEMQVGDDEFESRAPSNANVAGDQDDPNSPTYSSLNQRLDADARDEGTTIVQTIDRDGQVAEDSSLADYGVTAEAYFSETDHTVASVFWDFMNETGTIYEDGEFTEGRIVHDTVFVTGYPITEAYWATVTVAGTPQPVLMQVFERRVLTYTPENPDGWQVEAGNIGQHYYRWRYEEVPSVDPPGSDVPPMPLVSRNAPVSASSELEPAENAVSGDYDAHWRGEVPASITVDLSGASDLGQTLLAWFSDRDNQDFDFEAGTVGPSNLPRDYSIAVSQNGDDWQTVEEVTGNTLSSRQHLIDLSGSEYVRMEVTATNGSPGNEDVSLSLDVHDARDGSADNFLFLGDSITVGAMGQQGSTFAQLVNDLDSAHYPAHHNGGIGGWLSGDAIEHVDDWLPLFESQFVALAYGTNDALSGIPSEQFSASMQELVDMVSSEGKVAILPTIPYSTDTTTDQHVQRLNQVLDELVRQNEHAVAGPDLYSLFADNPDLISDDGIHPTGQGYAEIRAEWASFVVSEIYQRE